MENKYGLTEERYINKENETAKSVVHIFSYSTAEEREKNPELKSDLLYWSNGAGDLHYHGKFDIDEDQLPSELQYAYNELWSERYGTYCYLVENKNGYGIALTAEFDEYYAEDCDVDMETLFEHMRHGVYDIAKHQEFAKAEFYVGEFTGFQECHELAVVFPAMTDKEVFQKAAKLFDDVAYKTIEGRMEMENEKNLIPYKITISETLTRDVIVYANKKSLAIEKAEELCNEGVIDLTVNDFSSREVIASNVAKVNELTNLEVYGKSKISLDEKISRIKEKKEQVIKTLHKYKEEEYEK